jgi:hypothetical protein
MKIEILATGFALALAAGGALALGGCQEGPGERAGEAIDDATRGVRDTLSPDEPGERAGKKVDDAREEAEDAADDAADAARDATD